MHNKQIVQTIVIKRMVDVDSLGQVTREQLDVINNTSKQIISPLLHELCSNTFPVGMLQQSNNGAFYIQLSASTDVEEIVDAEFTKVED